MPALHSSTDKWQKLHLHLASKKSKFWRQHLEVMKLVLVKFKLSFSYLFWYFSLIRAQKVDLEVPFEMIDYLKHERHYVPFVTTLDNLIYIRGVLQFHKLYDNFTVSERFFLRLSYKQMNDLCLIYLYLIYFCRWK